MSCHGYELWAANTRVALKKLLFLKFFKECIMFSTVGAVQLSLINYNEFPCVPKHSAGGKSREMNGSAK